MKQRTKTSNRQTKRKRKLSNHKYYLKNKGRFTQINIINKLRAKIAEANKILNEENAFETFEEFKKRLRECFSQEPTGDKT
jgi:hypothetical protein